MPAAVRRCVDSIRSPAFILSPLWDVVYWNIAFARAWTIEPPGSAPFNAVAYQLTTMRERGLQGDSWEATSRRMIDQYRADYLAHAGDPAFEERLTELRMIDVFRARFDVGNIESPLVDPARFVLHPTLGRLDYTPVNFSMPDSQLTLTIQSMDTMSERRLHRTILDLREGFPSHVSCCRATVNDLSRRVRRDEMQRVVDTIKPSSGSSHR